MNLLLGSFTVPKLPLTGRELQRGFSGRRHGVYAARRPGPCARDGLQRALPPASLHSERHPPGRDPPGGAARHLGTPRVESPASSRAFFRGISLQNPLKIMKKVNKQP